MAERSAWIIVMRVVPRPASPSLPFLVAVFPGSSRAVRTTSSFVLAILDPQLLSLPPQVRRHLLVDVLEHLRRARHVAALQRAVAFGLLLGRRDGGLDLLLRGLVAFLGPFADADQVLREAADGVSERKA